MRRNFKLAAHAALDRRIAERIVLGALLLANLVAPWLVILPPGGSPEDLSHQLVSLQNQVAQRRAGVERTRAIVAKVEKARADGEQFLSSYFLGRRSAYSTIVSSLVKSAKEA